MSDHAAAVHPHQRDWQGRPIGWYMACGCGYCGPQRRSEGMAHHDMAAHLEAVERAGRPERGRAPLAEQPEVVA